MAENSRQLWKFVPIDQYSRPAEPATDAVRKGILGVWDRLRKRPSPENSFIAKEDLHQVPDELLRQAAPTPVWDPAVSALSTALERWLETPEPATSVQVLVGPPFGGVSEIATHWAHAHGWRLVTPPPTARVLEGGDDWFNELSSDTTAPLVIPSLEGCYVRHHDGLSLMRRVIDWLCTNRPCCLLACHSWAWAYFRKVLEVDVVFPPPLTLQGFDDERLQQWFRSLASEPGGADFKFLQANTGKFVLAPRDLGAPPEAGEQGRHQSTNNDRSGDVTNFLQYVAGYSRGNPGVAWSIWRHSLQLAADETARKAEAQNSTRVLWVKPWPEIELPLCSSQLSQNDLLVLHALLLHNDLPTELLPQVLPCTITEIMHSLHELHACRMLEQTNKRWHVTALGYPAARRLLTGEDYLSDQF
jgi:hypothetical protein